MYSQNYLVAQVATLGERHARRYRAAGLTVTANGVLAIPWQIGSEAPKASCLPGSDGQPIIATWLVARTDTLHLDTYMYMCSISAGKVLWNSRGREGGETPLRSTGIATGTHRGVSSPTSTCLKTSVTSDPWSDPRHSRPRSHSLVRPLAL